MFWLNVMKKSAFCKSQRWQILFLLEPQNNKNNHHHQTLEKRALRNLDCAALCWHVRKFNQSKLVILGLIPFNVP